MKTERVYGVADKAWQCVVGCDPTMPCAPRCWARKTVARVVECQRKDHPERAAFFQQALTPDGKRWSGQVFLDDSHLTDPLRWRKPAVIASGFHGDIGFLSTDDLTKVLRVACGALRQGHRLLFLTKQPELLVENLRFAMNRIYGFHWKPPEGINIGCSITNQADADRHRPAMAELAEMGWRTHVWYEPAIGPVNWQGWEFLTGLIAGGESGPQARPAHPDWFRAARDWCLAHGIPFTFKQWGEYCDWDNLPEETYRELDAEGWTPRDGFILIGKKRAGCLLDGREWKQFPGVK